MSDSEGRRGRFTPLRKLSDDELAVAAAGGDDKAFALLFERLQDPLYRYCMSILGNPEEARDALQNAMLKAYRALRGETREILDLRRRLDQIYANHSGQDIDKVHQDMDRDRYFTPDEALEYGLIDRVISQH